MADSSVAITAGAGTAIDTRTEGTNSNHRQVIVIGDPATNAGVAPVDATAGLKVDLGADNDVVVTNAGTFAVQATIAAAATSIGKAEDAAHSSGDVGVPAMTVRQDTAAALSGTDADYQPLITDGSGRLHVNVGNTVTVGSHAVTNAGTFAVQAAQSGTWAVDLGATDNAVLDAIAASVAAIDTDATTIIGHLDGVEGLLGTIDADTGSIMTAVQLIDDAIFAEDVAAQAADKGIAILAVRRDADTSLVGTDNDYANLQVDANGYLKVEIFDGGGSHTVDNAGTFVVQVDAAIPAGTNNIGDVDIASIAAGDNNIGNVDIVTVPTDPFGANADAAAADGSISAKLRFIASTGIPVTGTVTVGSHAVTNAGTFATQSAITAASGSIGSGAIASGAVASGAFASGALASGSVASGAFASGALAAGSIAEGAVAAGAASFVKLEDVANAGADAGVPAMAVRKAVPIDLSGTDGDYEFLQMDNGMLWASQPQVTISQTLTRPANTTTYAINDVMADVAATAGGDTFTGCAKQSGGSGIITDVTFAFDEDAATPLQGELFLFDTAMTAPADNAAFTVTDAQARTIVAKIPFALEDIGANGFCHVQNLSIAFTTVGSADLRSLIRVKNAYVPTTNSSVLTTRLKIIQTT
jgi:hypothetical protein